MADFNDLWNGATVTNPYGTVEDYQRYLSNQGGDAGSVFRQSDYDAANQYALQGYDGAWNYNPTRGNNGEFEQVQPGGMAGQSLEMRNLTRDYNGGQGTYDDAVRVDNSPNAMHNFLDWAAPLAVAAITAGAGGAAMGGYLAAGEAAGAAGGAGVAAGEAAGGTAAAAGEAAAPAFTYGAEAAPWAGWSQAGGAELGSGLYGTDVGSMAGTFGTTAGGATGEIGSALGTGLAADGGAWAGVGGGWPALMEGAGSGMSLADALKYGKNAYSAYNALSAATAKPGAVGGASLGSALSGGSSAQGFGSSVQMPQQAQATAPLTMLNTPQFTNPAAPAAKDATPDEMNNSANILRLAQALRGKTA